MHLPALTEWVAVPL